MTLRVLTKTALKRLAFYTAMVKHHPQYVPQALLNTILNTNIPYNYTINNLNLSTWTSNQRHRYKLGKLSKERIKKLNDLNFNIIERIVLEDKYIIKKEKSED